MEALRKGEVEPHTLATGIDGPRLTASAAYLQDWRAESQQHFPELPLHAEGADTDPMPFTSVPRVELVDLCWIQCRDARGRARSLSAPSPSLGSLRSHPHHPTQTPWVFCSGSASRDHRALHQGLPTYGCFFFTSNLRRKDTENILRFSPPQSHEL